MFFWCLQFLPKNERKQVNLRYHSSKVEFVCSFFGRNVSLKKPFRLCLTFSNITQQRIYYIKLWRASKSPFAWFHPVITNNLVNSSHLKCHKMPSIKLKAHNFLIAFFPTRVQSSAVYFVIITLLAFIIIFFTPFPPTCQVGISCCFSLLFYLLVSRNGPFKKKFTFSGLPKQFQAKE